VAGVNSLMTRLDSTHSFKLKVQY